MISAKPVLSTVKPYLSGRHCQKLFEEGARALKLDSNEATISPGPRVLTALSEFVRSAPLNWYPDVNSSLLIDALATYTGLARDYVQTFNGSDHALETICRTYLSKGDEVVLCMPTYDHFRLFAETCDATLVPVFGPSPFISKPEELLAAVTEKTKIIYLANPNNPCGTIYSQQQIKLLLERAPNCLLIVDEAYFEFSRETAAPLVANFPNLIVTRSFSKAFGLAGLRVGYVLSQPQNIFNLDKIRNGKSINSLAQIAACAALEDLEYTERYVTEVATARAWTINHLHSLGVATVNTPANFILMKVAFPSKVVKHLESHHIYVRDRSHIPQLEGCLRLSIGHLLVMERFWRDFKDIPMEFLGNKSETLSIAKAHS